MSLVRQSIVGLSFALIAVVILWATWLTGQAENQFARASLSSANCITPTDWSRTILPLEDDVASSIESAGYTVEEILVANCLPPNDNLPLGEAIYLPSDALALLDPACGPPPGWTYHATEAGDVLSSLAQEFEVGLEELLRANCFLDMADFKPGVRIYAPTVLQEP